MFLSSGSFVPQFVKMTHLYLVFYAEVDTTPWIINGVKANGSIAQGNNSIFHTCVVPLL